MKDFEQFKEEVTTLPRWIVSLDENDLKDFQGDNDGTITILEAATEDATQQRLSILLEDITEQYNATLVAIASRCLSISSSQYPSLS